MADRRRRKLDDEGEESVPPSESATVPGGTVRRSECESEGEHENADIDVSSEYESFVDAEEKTEDGSETETDEESTETEDGSTETGSETEGAYTDEEGLEERQSGDGEEQPDKDKPDDDEDKKNPAYVPRKGAFYEHDFRQGEGPEGEESTDQQPKKKLWQDEAKWAHDRYDEDSQAPKSREELIAIYGYDIRTADKPPDAPPQRARRGRRGGPRRDRQMHDFIPRMAVIDTTEDGSDSVPNLGDDGLILYEGSRHRGGRTRQGEGRRGRGGGRYNDSPRQNDAREERSERKQGGYSNQPDKGRRVEIRSQDVRTMEDYPTLDESRQQSHRDQRRDDRRPENNRYERTVSDEGKNYGRREEYDNRGGVAENGYRGDESRRGRGGGHFQQERRGGYNSNRGRDSGRQHGRADQGDWRAAQAETRARHGDEDGGDRSNRGYDYRGQGQNTEGSWRTEKGYNRNDNKRGGYSSYEQPPRYQQQKQVSGVSGDERREFTNTAYKANEDYKTRGAGGSGGSANTGQGGVSEAGDANTLSSKNLVISNKENVQTINVTITSTTTEKKSYAKERRAKGGSGGSSRLGETVPDSSEGKTGGPAYPGVSQPRVEQTQTSSGGTKRYSSQRQQALATKGGGFPEPPPTDAGAKLYNPALPPPSFFQRDQAAPGQHGAPPASAGVQDPAHFQPPLLPPTAALPFGLPASSTGLPLAPNTAGGIPVNSQMFQPPRGPPPIASLPAGPGPAVIPSPYLPTGLLYSGPGPRVPPPGVPSGFPLSLAYTSPPPAAPPVTSATPVPPSPQGAGTQQGPPPPNSQPKKVYRGDITYYAPELQQPSRTPQKRLKAAIPIVDPQEIRQQKQKEARSTPERHSSSSSKDAPKSGRAVTGSLPAQNTSQDSAKVREPSAVVSSSGTVSESPQAKPVTESKASSLSEQVQAEVQKELSCQVDKLSSLEIEAQLPVADLPTESKVSSVPVVEKSLVEKSINTGVIVPPDKVDTPGLEDSSAMVVPAESS